MIISSGTPLFLLLNAAKAPNNKISIILNLFSFPSNILVQV